MNVRDLLKAVQTKTPIVRPQYSIATGKITNHKISLEELLDTETPYEIAPECIPCSSEEECLALVGKPYEYLDETNTWTVAISNRRLFTALANLDYEHIRPA